MYEKRVYRDSSAAGDLVRFTVVVKETDLLILADTDLSRVALDVVIQNRHQLESYISRQPEFLTSLVPVRLLPGAPDIAVIMADAALLAGVGPMAAVAGAFAEVVGRELLNHSAQVIVENGGDIFIKTDVPRLIALYAGDSPISGRMALRINPQDTPLGVCTSSGKVGPSLSLGVSHASCVISRSTALADAAATTVGNAVKREGEVEAAIEIAQTIDGVVGAVVISGEKMAAWGMVELVKV